MSLQTEFFLALLLTYCIEIPLMIIIIRHFFQDKISIFRIIFVGICTTGITLPYLWFILPEYLDGIMYLIIGEMLVFLTETLIMNQFLPLNIKRTLICSFITNAASLFLGWIIL